MTTSASSNTDHKHQFTISELAEEFSVTTRALRFYEAKGLLNPVRRGTRRIYGRRDRARLKLVLLGKRADLTLAEIKEILDLYDHNDGGAVQRQAALVKLRAQAHAIEEQICEKRRALDEVHEMCRLIERIDKKQSKSKW